MEKYVTVTTRIRGQKGHAQMAQSNAGFPVKALTNTMQAQDSIDAPARFYSGVLWGKFLVGFV